jgi:Tfp pilus assembly protein PilN
MATIQFNLLPDVKLEYIKTRRTKQMVVSVSIVASIIAFVIFLFLIFTVDVFQKKNTSDLSKDIKKYSSQLQAIPDLNKILTIQGQLATLPSLHDQKLVSSRTFAYLQQITPSTATISDVKIDYTADTINITGAAPSLDIVNTYTDTMKFTTYSTKDKSVVKQPAFKNVVLSSFARNSDAATFTVTASFDPIIFSNTEEPALTVPNIQSTRSSVDQPSTLFKQNTTTTSTTSGATR